MDGEHSSISPGRLRIAVASSGLGHITRGVEAWAEDLAAALLRVGQDVTLYQGPGRGSGNTRPPWRVALPCGRRIDPGVQRWVRRLRRFGSWRYGLGSAYEVEQTTFAFHLWRRIRKDFDILHVQDPWIAHWLSVLHKAGLSKPRVILAPGTGEPLESLRNYPVLQHLAPCYATEYEGYKTPSQKVFAIPNFVDAARFCPGDRREARRSWDLPEHDLLVLCAAAINARYKRIDCLIGEFAQFAESASRPVYLVIAGARESETDGIIRVGRERLGERVRFLENVPRERMPSLYQAADIFALPALTEVFGIVILEALASGLPVASNRTPVLEWIVGPAGCLTDISTEGALAAQLQWIGCPGRRHQLSQAARVQALERFSEQAVIPQIVKMYEEVAGWSA
jgi:glycosyltransferase involved in cell wall biosynthesis